MSESKIQIKVGIVEFSGEGNQDWLSEQLNKILDRIPELLKIELASSPLTQTIAPNSPVSNGVSGVKEKSLNIEKTGINLPSFLKDKNATSQQVRKFLATAAFLQERGKERLATGDIIAELKKANQSKLNNASDCLNSNVKKGFCEKDNGNGFFVTQEGFNELQIEI